MTLFLIDFLNFILLGALTVLTIKWMYLLYRAYLLKLAQKEPLDRMICITSKDILKGVIRKRARKAGAIALTGIKQKKIIDEQTQALLDAVYESLAEQNLKIYLIPNEDIHKANKRGLLSDSSKYYLNDELIVRLSDREKEEIVNRNIEKKRKVKEEQELRELEYQKKSREKEVEDQINI